MSRSDYMNNAFIEYAQQLCETNRQETGRLTKMQIIQQWPTEGESIGIKHPCSSGTQIHWFAANDGYYMLYFTSYESCYSKLLVYD